MRPPPLASAVALAHGNLIGAAFVIAAVVLVALVLACLRAPSAREHIGEPLKRAAGLHIFGPDDDDEPLVHVPVMSTRAAPVGPALSAAADERASDVASRALDRVAAFAVRQPHAPAPAAPESPPAHAPTPAVATPNPSFLSDCHPPPAPTSSRQRGELPLDGDILLVEDDGAIADLFGMLLRTRGYSARHAHDGVEGIAMLLEQRPALILLDMMMPRMDGIQFLEALRSWPKTSAIPVVVLTNTENLHLADRAMALGAVEYLVKAHMRPTVLVGALPHWLRGNRALCAIS
jgi:CheY-like chemotaxis protein